MSAPFVSFKDVRAAVSMIQVLEHYRLMETLRNRGNDALTGPCPIHRGTNPTQFRVSLSKNCWNCFGACKGGNVLDFVAAMEGVEIRKAALLLVEWFTLQSVSGGQNTSSETRCRQPLPAARRREMLVPDVSQPLTQEAESEEHGENPPLRFTELKGLDCAHPYLLKKGFSREMMETFGIGYCRKGIMKERIAIPIHNHKGELVAYAGRMPDDRIALEKRYKYPEGFRRDWELYNAHRAAETLHTSTRGLLLVEDFFDVVRLHEAGYENAIGLMGRRVSSCQREMLKGFLGRNAPITLLMAEGPGLAETVLCLARIFTVRLLPCQPEFMSGEELKKMLEPAA